MIKTKKVNQNKIKKLKGGASNFFRGVGANLKAAATIDALGLRGARQMSSDSVKAVRASNNPDVIGQQFSRSKTGRALNTIARTFAGVNPLLKQKLVEGGPIKPQQPQQSQEVVIKLKPQSGGYKKKTQHKKQKKSTK
jgi:hypothetical protein